MKKVSFFKGKIPIDRHLFKRSLNLEPSDELKEMFEDYFSLLDTLVREWDRIEKEDGGKDETILLLTERYRPINEKVVIEIRQSGNMKSKFTEQLLEFIFICMYKLIDGLQISQNEAEKIFDLNPNRFSKLGIFPERCLRSYSEEADIFLPIEKERDHIILICNFINKKIVTNYACRGVIALARFYVTRALLNGEALFLCRIIYRKFEVNL